MQKLRKCELLVPKKAATQSVAAVSSEEEENLAQRLATRIALIQEKSGLFKSGQSRNKEIYGIMFSLWKGGAHEK